MVSVNVNVNCVNVACYVVPRRYEKKQIAFLSSFLDIIMNICRLAADLLEIVR